MEIRDTVSSRTNVAAHKGRRKGHQKKGEKPAGRSMNQAKGHPAKSLEGEGMESQRTIKVIE